MESNAIFILKLLEPKLNDTTLDMLFPYMYTQKFRNSVETWMTEPESPNNTISSDCGFPTVPSASLIDGDKNIQQYGCNEILKSNETITTITEPAIHTMEPRVEPVQPLPKIQVQSTKQPSEHIFCPKQDNTLFWSVFVGVYGYTDYLNIGNKYNNAELEEKQTIMEALQKQPGKLKECNFRVTNQMVQELFSELMVCKRDQLFSLLAFTVYYDKTIYVVFENNTYLRFSPYKNVDAKPQANTTIVLYCRVGARNNIYSLEQDVTDSMIDQIHSSKLCLEHYTKPLRGVSSYKMDELETIAEKLGLEIDKKWKKQEIYEKIAAICSLEQVIKNS